MKFDINNWFLWTWYSSMILMLLGMPLLENVLFSNLTGILYGVDFE